jgi:hypothetical protein
LLSIALPCIVKGIRQAPIEAHDMTQHKYLAWGGENGDDYSVVTVADIKKDTESSHYSGYRLWEHFALVGPKSGAEWPETWPVSITSAASRETDSDDCIHQDYAVVTPTGEVLDTFATRIDGRA